MQLPIALAADLCDVTVDVLVNELSDGSSPCEASSNSDAVVTTEDGGPVAQDGLVNVNVTDVVVQAPISIAANVCDVTVAVLVSRLAGRRLAVRRRRHRRSDHPSGRFARRSCPPTRSSRNCPSIRSSSSCPWTPSWRSCPSTVPELPVTLPTDSITVATPLRRRATGKLACDDLGRATAPALTSGCGGRCNFIDALVNDGSRCTGGFEPELDEVLGSRGRGKSMVDAPGAVGGAVVSKARDWKEPIGRLGLVGQGVVATIIGLLAIRIAIGEKDEAATSEGAVAWLADQPLGKFLLVALTVALFALALWRFLCAVMGDPVEGSEPKDRLKYAVLGVVYLLLAITTLGVTIANWTGSGDTAGSEESGDEGSQQAASTLFEWPAGRWLVGILGVAVIGYAGYNFHKQVVKKKFAERLDAGEGSWIVRLGLVGYTAQSLVYAVVGYFFIQAAIAFKSTTAKGPSGALIELADTTWGKVLLWIIAIGLFAYGVFCIAEAKYRKAA